jgi:hypothetical protein
MTDNILVMEGTMSGTIYATSRGLEQSILDIDTYYH